MIDVGKKIIFSHLRLKFAKSADTNPKNFYCKKSIWVSNIAKFHADFKFSDRGFKKLLKKLYAINHEKMCKNENTENSHIVCL
jgi:hypothetical protein